MKLRRRIFSALLCLMLLISFMTAATAEEFKWEIPKETMYASFWEADISSIREALEAELITSEELTQYYLDRIEAYNDTYNCFITLCDDALEQAQKRDEEIAAGAEGALLGVPIVIKDNIDYAGYYTTNGHEKEDSRIASSNAQVVEYLLQEGAVIIGKTNMSTEAQDAKVSVSKAAGETKNAYNSELASGGSSGGSAVATSLNFATASLGTDTNSSLRYPAVLNGCVSLRVTWDTLSTDGIVRLNSTRDVPGAITRTVQDQAIMLDVLSGGQTSYESNLDPFILEGLRIGVLKELSGLEDGLKRDESIDDEVIAAFQNAMEELRLCGAEIVEVSIPNITSLASDTFSSNESSYKVRMYETIRETMDEQDLAALIFPSYLHTPHRSGVDSTGTYWNANNLEYINNTSKFSSCAGLPEIAIPIGYHSLGAGIGMEIATLKNEEQLLLDIAYAYTLRYGHRQAPANALDLYADAFEGGLSEIVDRYYTAVYDFENAKKADNEETVKDETEPLYSVEVEQETPNIQEESTQKEQQTPHTLVYVFFALLAALIICVLILFLRIHRNKKRYKTTKVRNR